MIFQPIPDRASIHILEPQTAIRHLMRTYLETLPCPCEIHGESTRVEETLRLCAGDPPHLLICDSLLHGTPILPFLRCLREQHPAVKILVFSSLHSPETVRSLLNAGVDGLLPRSAPITALGRAIGILLSGGCYVSEEIREITTPERPTLTERELTALRLIAEGFSTKEMASEMGVAVKTGEKYRERIMQKLKLHDAVGLTHFAIRSGLVSP